jgi:hypothetical protein
MEFSAHVAAQFSLLMSRTNLDFQAQQDIAPAAAMKSDALAGSSEAFRHKE